jgi:hypothetical protein
MNKYSSVLGICQIIVLALFLISGCLSNRAVSPSGNQPPSIANPNPPHVPKQININETVTSGDISYVASAWGFTPYWGMFRPHEGAKFVWVYVKTTNIGDTPILPMPGDFRLQYRGTTAEAVESNYKGYILPHTGSYGTEYSKENYFPSVSEEGYLYFEVPEKLQEGEVSLLASLGDENFSTNLVNGVPFSGPHLLVENATFKSCSTQFMPTTYICYLYLTVFNDRHLPLHSPFTNVNEVVVPFSPSIDGVALAAPQDNFSITDIDPFEGKTVTTPYVIRLTLDKGGINNSRYKVHGTDVVGKPGEAVDLKLCDLCSPESIKVTLPMPPPDFYE